MDLMDFELTAPFIPMGDQPEAIDALVKGIEKNYRNQVLLGATGTGKTFAMANIIQRLQMPALIMAHNKTLAAQLYAEFKEFFQKMQLNISSLTMIIISRRLMSRVMISILKKKLR